MDCPWCLSPLTRPLAALVAVMTTGASGIFNWSSFRNVGEFPQGSKAAMLADVVGMAEAVSWRQLR